MSHVPQSQAPLSQAPLGQAPQSELTSSEAAELVQTAPIRLGADAAPGTPLYVHLPFCAAKCHYCDFFSVPVERGGSAPSRWDVDAMVEAILVEARGRAAPAPRTVFLGGGTPSLLSEAQLRRLLDGLDELLGWRASATEVTAECNPESLDRAKARALLDLGVRRLSIGFQSLDDATLALFGRVHSVADSFAAYDAARAAGIEHLNIDLIYAIPGQTAATWARDLARVLDLGPEHLSAYNLTFEEDTRFKRWLDQGRLQSAPEEVELEMLATTRALTARAGLAAYEVSNHARPGEACAHNVNYWLNGPYVGLGPGAVSQVGGIRAGNSRAIVPYLRRVAASGQALDWREELAPLARLGETWWLGLRLAAGVEPSEARATARLELTPGAPDPALAIAEEHRALGLLERVDGRYRLTSAGLPVADGVARQFLTRLGRGD
ncbi:MAG: radical SAM family heme chaperone HemW [Planctomycetota bacterium]